MKQMLMFILLCAAALLCLKLSVLFSMLRHTLHVLGNTLMGQIYASYFRSSDTVHTENDGISQTDMVECDTSCSNTSVDKSIVSDKQDSRLNVQSVYLTSLDNIHSASNAPSATSTVCARATAAVDSSPGKAQHQPWFFANMTEEHWERLNIMCIVSPSSS